MPAFTTWQFMQMLLPSYLLPVRRVLQDNICRTASLIGHGVLLVPLPLLAAAGADGIAARIPLTHGGGALCVRIASASAPVSAGDVAAQVQGSAFPNKLGVCPPSLSPNGANVACCVVGRV